MTILTKFCIISFLITRRPLSSHNLTNLISASFCIIMDQDYEAEKLATINKKAIFEKIIATFD